MQENARSARLVAKNQLGLACIVIPLAKTVRVERGPRHITINEEKIILHNEKEVNLLSCLLEAANFYYSERPQSYNSLDVLKAYTVLVAVKNRYLDLVAGLMANSSMIVLPSDTYQVVCTVTAVAKDYIDGRLNEQILSEDAFCRDMNEGEVPREMLTLTSWAIRIGHTPLVQLFIAENTVLREDSLIQRSLSPLSMTAYQGHQSVAQLLISSKYGGKNEDFLHTPDRYGMMTLHYASQRGHEKLVRLLLESGANINVATVVKDPYRTPLHLAAQAGHSNVVQLLLDKGAKVDARDASYYTPLLLAAEKGHENVMAIFLEETDNVLYRDVEGINVLQFALESGMSKQMHDLCYERFWKTDPTTSNSKRVRSLVTFEIDTDWAMLYVDTKDAKIEYPSGRPSHVQDIHQAAIRIHRPASVIAKSFQFSLDFSVIHPPGALRFSTAHGSTGTGNRHGSTRVRIHNGGSFETTPTKTWRSFRTHQGVDTDPIAEEVPVSTPPTQFSAVSQAHSHPPIPA